MNSPLVSVCIPVHNVIGFLDEAIASVLAQTYGSFELVIANGASQPEPRRLIDEIVSRNSDPRVQLILNPANYSMVENWNSAIMKARGIYLKLLCADDVLMPDCLQRQVQALQKYPNVVLAAGSRVIINRKGNRLFTRNGIRSRGIHTGSAMIRRCILAGTNIIGDPVCVMWRRTGIDQLGMFDPSVTYCIDMEYWLRLLSTGDLYYDTAAVGFYRIHKNAASVRLAQAVAADVIYAAKLQVQRGSIILSRFEFMIVFLKATLLGFIRQLCYKFLG
jgi:glycosyltransferase involved in cell wall biosynthesis